MRRVYVGGGKYISVSDTLNAKQVNQLKEAARRQMINDEPTGAKGARTLRPRTPQEAAKQSEAIAHARAFERQYYKTHPSAGRSITYYQHPTAGQLLSGDQGRGSYVTGTYGEYSPAKSIMPADKRGRSIVVSQEYDYYQHPTAGELLGGDIGQRQTRRGAVTPGRIVPERIDMLREQYAGGQGFEYKGREYYGDAAAVKQYQLERAGKRLPQPREEWVVDGEVYASKAMAEAQTWRLGGVYESQEQARPSQVNLMKLDLGLPSFIFGGVKTPAKYSVFPADDVSAPTQSVLKDVYVTAFGKRLFSFRDIPYFGNLMGPVEEREYISNLQSAYRYNVEEEYQKSIKKLNVKPAVPLAAGKVDYTPWYDWRVKEKKRLDVEHAKALTEIDAWSSKSIKEVEGAYKWNLRIKGFTTGILLGASGAAGVQAKSVGAGVWEGTKLISSGLIGGKASEVTQEYTGSRLLATGVGFGVAALTYGGLTGAQGRLFPSTPKLVGARFGETFKGGKLTMSKQVIAGEAVGKSMSFSLTGTPGATVSRGFGKLIPRPQGKVIFENVLGKKVIGLKGSTTQFIKDGQVFATGKFTTETKRMYGSLKTKGQVQTEFTGIQKISTPVGLKLPKFKLVKPGALRSSFFSGAGKTTGLKAPSIGYSVEGVLKAGGKSQFTRVSASQAIQESVLGSKTAAYKGTERGLMEYVSKDYSKAAQTLDYNMRFMETTKDIPSFTTTRHLGGFKLGGGLSKVNMGNLRISGGQALDLTMPPLSDVTATLTVSAAKQAAAPGYTASMLPGFTTAAPKQLQRQRTFTTTLSTQSLTKMLQPTPSQRMQTGSLTIPHTQTRNITQQITIPDITQATKSATIFQQPQLLAQRQTPLQQTPSRQSQMSMPRVSLDYMSAMLPASKMPALKPMMPTVPPAAMGNLPPIPALPRIWFPLLGGAAGGGGRGFKWWRQGKVKLPGITGFQFLGLKQPRKRTKPPKRKTKRSRKKPRKKRRRK
jgi:hypothetical protein